jgi:hypothetical protein
MGSPSQSLAEPEDRFLKILTNGDMVIQTYVR